MATSAATSWITPPAAEATAAAPSPIRFRPRARLARRRATAHRECGSRRRARDRPSVVSTAGWPTADGRAAPVHPAAGSPSSSRGRGVVDVAGPSQAPTVLDDVDLLVVGAPTHVFGLSRPWTRRAASRRGGQVSEERGVREWLAELEPAGRPVRVAVFDTRVRKPLIPGSAAHVLRRRLRALGFDVMPPISFSVHRTVGPLVDEEVDVAEEWAERVAREAADRASCSRPIEPAP